MSDHYIVSCSCGEIILQCRCASSNKKAATIVNGCVKCKTKSPDSTVEIAKIMAELIDDIERRYRRLENNDTISRRHDRDAIAAIPLPTLELRRWCHVIMNAMVETLGAPDSPPLDPGSYFMGVQMGLLIAARNQVTLDVIDV